MPSAVAGCAALEGGQGEGEACYTFSVTFDSDFYYRPSVQRLILLQALVAKVAVATAEISMVRLPQPLLVLSCNSYVVGGSFLCF